MLVTIILASAWHVTCPAVTVSLPCHVLCKSQWDNVTVPDDVTKYPHSVTHIKYWDVYPEMYWPDPESSSSDPLSSEHNLNVNHLERWEISHYTSYLSSPRCSNDCCHWPRYQYGMKWVVTRAQPVSGDRANLSGEGNKEITRRQDVFTTSWSRPGMETSPLRNVPTNIADLDVTSFNLHYSFKLILERQSFKGD